MKRTAPFCRRPGWRCTALIVESCGNVVLTRFVVSLQDHFRRFRAVSPQLPERVLDFHHEHLQILDALKKGDGARAEQLIQRHLERAAELLMERLLGQPIQVAADADDSPARARLRLTQDQKTNGKGSAGRAFRGPGSQKSVDEVGVYIP